MSKIRMLGDIMFRYLLIGLMIFGAAQAAEKNESLGQGMVNPGYHEKPDWFKSSFLDIREDVAEATDANKRVILYFYQDGCPYCAKLLNDNFGNRICIFSHYISCSRCH